MLSVCNYLLCHPLPSHAHAHTHTHTHTHTHNEGPLPEMYTHHTSNFAGWSVSLKSIPMVTEAEFPGVICCGPAVFLIVIPLCSRVAPIPTPDRLLSSVFLKTSSTASILRDEMCGMRVKRYSTESPPPVIRSNSLCIFFGTTVGLTTYRKCEGRG